jgi:hypothetical protein
VTQPIRFLFDECISWRVVEGQLAQSLELYAPHATVAHFAKKFPCGTKDRVWVPQIANEGGWIVVSMDRGTHSKVEERLPLICRAFQVTHVLLSPGLEKRNMYYRALAIETRWPELVNAAAYPHGTGFALSMRETKSGVMFQLHKSTDAISASDLPRVQKKLLDC